MKNKTLYTNQYKQALNHDFFNQLMDFEIQQTKDTFGISYLGKNTSEMILDHIYTKLIKNDFESLSWSNGGTSGGYGGTTHHISPDDEPEFTNLDIFLSVNHPNITFLQYKKILKNITKDSNTSSDYYGGEQEIKSKKLLISQLHDSLKESNLLTTEQLIKPEDMFDILTTKVDDFVKTLSPSKNYKKKP